MPSRNIFLMSNISKITMQILLILKTTSILNECKNDILVV